MSCHEISIIIRGPDGDKATYIFKRNEDISQILETFSKTLSLPVHALVFVLNGKRISPRRTPDELGMEDGDVLEAYLGICRDYSYLLQDKNSWDVKLKCRDGKVVNANRAIILDGMENMTIREGGVIQLSDFDINAVEIFVKILYSSQINGLNEISNPAIVLQIIKMAVGFKEKWLSDKAFEIFCLRNKSLSTEERLELERNDKENLSADLGELLESGESSDFTIICGEEEFPCHRGILLARSKVLKAMIKSGMKEANNGQLIIKDLEPEIVRIVLKFIYTGEVIFDNKASALKLLEVGNMYELRGLKNMSEDHLIYVLGNKNVLDLLVAADMYNADILKEFAIKWIVANRTNIDKKEGWKEVLVKFPNLLLDMFDAVSN